MLLTPQDQWVLETIGESACRKTIENWYTCYASSKWICTWRVSFISDFTCFKQMYLILTRMIWIIHNTTLAPAYLWLMNGRYAWLGSSWEKSMSMHDRFLCAWDCFCHTMDLLWEKFQWILPLNMKPISFQSKGSVVCSVTAAIFIDFCLKKLNVFSQHIGKKQMNIWIPQNKSPGIEMVINFLCELLEILLNDAASTYCEKS